MAIQSGNFSKLLEPGLRKIFFETYKQKAEQYSKVFNVLTSTKAVETDLRMGGFSEWNEKGTLDSTEYEEMTPTDIVRYSHIVYSKGFQIEKELVDDEQYNVINKRSAALARSARSTIERKAASVLNNAFIAQANAFKGEALVQNHTRLDGGTTTNAIGDLPLSEANLETAMKLAADQVDERGLKIQMLPDVLIVPRSLEFTAEKIIKSVQLPGNNFNDINPMQGKFRVVVLDYLTDSNNWFLMDSTMNPLNFFWRERLSFKSTNDFDTDVAKYKGRMRFTYGWTDHRGILGAQVTGA